MLVLVLLLLLLLLMGNHNNRNSKSNTMPPTTILIGAISSSSVSSSSSLSLSLEGKGGSSALVLFEKKLGSVSCVRIYGLAGRRKVIREKTVLAIQSFSHLEEGFLDTLTQAASM
jgi:hypothetical protein